MSFIVRLERGHTDAGPPDLRDAWWRRLFSHFLLSRLPESAVEEALESLGDIYAWHTARPTPLRPQLPSRFVESPLIERKQSDRFILPQE